MKVQEILFRMQQHPDDVDTMKTCCGALAILSRDEANKLMIVRDGLRLILSTMSVHDKRGDLLEAACDLLWRYLAFPPPHALCRCRCAVTHISCNRRRKTCFSFSKPPSAVWRSTMTWSRRLLGGTAASR